MTTTLFTATKAQARHAAGLLTSWASYGTATLSNNTDEDAQAAVQILQWCWDALGYQPEHQRAEVVADIKDHVMGGGPLHPDDAFCQELQALLGASCLPGAMYDRHIGVKP